MTQNDWVERAKESKKVERVSYLLRKNYKQYNTAVHTHGTLISMK
jgi:hypothetical protein